MGPIFEQLVKRGEITDATQDQDAMTDATEHYLTKSTSGPMVKAMPRGGYGESTGSPSVENKDETELVVDSSIFDTKVRELVQGAGGAYNFKAALANGTAMKVDPQFAPAVVVNHSLSRAAQNLQRNAGLLTALITKTQQRRKAKGSASGGNSGSASGSSATGGTSDDDTYNVDGEVMNKAQLADRIRADIMNGLSNHMVKSNVDPRRLSAGQLASLMKTVPAGSPIHMALNKTMAKAMRA